VDHAQRIIPVEIHGQQYPIRTSLDAAYVARLAAFVDEKMRLASREAPASDTLKVAVLAALNIADECFRVREEQERSSSVFADRAAELERVLDLALGTGDSLQAAGDRRLQA
jgi:cell division protein ZapA